MSAKIGHSKREVLRENATEDPKGTLRAPEVYEEDDTPGDGGSWIADTVFAILVTTLPEGRIITNGGRMAINNGTASIPARTIRQIAC